MYTKCLIQNKIFSVSYWIFKSKVNNFNFWKNRFYKIRMSIVSLNNIIVSNKYGAPSYWQYYAKCKLLWTRTAVRPSPIPTIRLIYRKIFVLKTFLQLNIKILLYNFWGYIFVFRVISIFYIFFFLIHMDSR